MKNKLVIGFFTLVAMSSCNTGNPSNFVVFEEITLNKNLKAVVFSKSETKSMSSVQISIIPIDKQLEENEEGNCFFAEVVTDKAKGSIKVVRENENNLEVLYKENIKVYYNKGIFIDKGDTIRIKYLPYRSQIE